MEISEVLNIDKTQIIEPNNIISEFSKKLDEKSIINSGSKNFDKVLDGGFKKSNVYLIFGQNRTGKTQLCHQICVQAYKLFSEENNKFNIFYLDSENTFRPERITQLCKAQEMDSNAILKNIRVSNIMSNSAFLLVLKKLEKELETASQSIIIIDSINNHYRSEQGDPNIKYKKAKSDFISILSKIDILTKKFNTFTIAAAQVSPNFVEGAIVQDLPVGNIFLNHFFSEFLFLSHKEDNKKFVHLINSHNIPEKKVLYKITSEGIEDYKI
jgi:DNA repair protein RadA